MVGDQCWAGARRGQGQHKALESQRVPAISRQQATVELFPLTNAGRDKVTGSPPSSLQDSRARGRTAPLVDVAAQELLGEPCRVHGEPHRAACPTTYERDRKKCESEVLPPARGQRRSRG